MRRLLFHFVCFCGFCSAFGQSQVVWDGSVADAFAGGTGTEEDPYLIETPAQLAKLAQDVNSREKYEGVYFLQTADLDLGGENNMLWSPIGELGGQFYGTYDGNHKEISNLYINSEEKTYHYAGLFGIISESGLVKNVVLDGKISANTDIGAVVCMCYGDVEGCVSSVEITSKRNLGGGVVGTLYGNGSVRESVFAGKITGISATGGIAGNSHGELSHVLNLGQIVSTEGSPQSSFGGLAGYNSGKIQYGINAGSIDGDAFGEGTSGWVGGLAGMNISETGITDCINIGLVSGAGGVGIIVGPGEKKPMSGIYYDVQLANGLLAGDEFVDNDEIKFMLTEVFAAGEESVFSFSDNGEWKFSKGSYPQLNCFAESDFELFRQLSALASVPVIAKNAEVWGALRSGFSVPAKAEYEGGSFPLEWKSETDGLVFDGQNCSFTAPEQDTRLRFYTGIPGTKYRKYMSSPYYAMYREIETPAYSTEEGRKVYEIKNFANMAWINGIANGMILTDADQPALPEYTTFTNSVIRLKNDIDFAGYNWWPIAGCGPALRFFGGNFDGNGYAIRNLYVNKPGETSVGLFGLAGGEGSCIRNLKLEGGSVSGSQYVGAFVGQASVTEYSNCINLSCNVNGDFCVGGLFGLVFGTRIMACMNSAEVNSVKGYLGGVVAVLSDDLNHSSYCEQSCNTGNLYSEAGLAGGIVSSISEFSVVKNCFNTGEIGGDDDMMGGIGASAFFGSVENCYNAGKVKKPVGFIGDMNIGDILGQASDTYLSNNYYDKDISAVGGGVGEEDIEGVKGLSTDEMKDNDAFVDLLDSDIWAMDTEGVNGGYPVFRWMKNGIEEHTITDGSINLYPNPCTDYLCWDNSMDVVRVSVYDVQGRMVCCFDVDGEKRISVAELADGFYMVRLQSSDNRIYDVKVIKNN